jgi:hypothetical protein
MMHRLKLHKVLIQSLSFSHDEKYLASLGGQDDNTLVIWDCESGKALIGNPVGNNVANKVKFFNNTHSKCVTIHHYGVRTWDCDLEQKKVKYTEILMNSIKRVFSCLTISSCDSNAFLGTTTGDIVTIDLQRNLFKGVGP